MPFGKPGRSSGGGGGGGQATPLSDAVPQAPGTASAGTAAAAARGDHRHALPADATSSAAGLMAAADKSKLDGIETGATAGGGTAAAASFGAAGGAATVDSKAISAAVALTADAITEVALTETLNSNYSYDFKLGTSNGSPTTISLPGAAILALEAQDSEPGEADLEDATSFKIDNVGTVNEFSDYGHSTFGIFRKTGNNALYVWVARASNSPTITVHRRLVRSASTFADRPHLPPASEEWQNVIVRSAGGNLWALESREVEVETSGYPLLGSILAEVGITGSNAGWNARGSGTYGSAAPAPMSKYNGWGDTTPIDDLGRDTNPALITPVSLHFQSLTCRLELPVGDGTSGAAPTLAQWLAYLRGPSSTASANRPDMLLWVENVTNDKRIAYDVGGGQYSAGPDWLRWTMTNPVTLYTSSDISATSDFFDTLDAGDEIRAWMLPRSAADSFPSIADIQGSNRNGTWTAFAVEGTNSPNWLGAFRRHNRPTATIARFGKQILDLDDGQFYEVIRTGTHGHVGWFQVEYAVVFPEDDAVWNGIFVDEAQADQHALAVNNYAAWGGTVYRCTATTGGYPRHTIREWVRLDQPLNAPTGIFYAKGATERLPDVTAGNVPEAVTNAIAHRGVSEALVGAGVDQDTGKLRFQTEVNETLYDWQDEWVTFHDAPVADADISAAYAITAANGSGIYFSLKEGIYDISVYWRSADAPTGVQMKPALGVAKVLTGTDDILIYRQDSSHQVTVDLIGGSMFSLDFEARDIAVIDSDIYYILGIDTLRWAGDQSRTGAFYMAIRRKS